MAIKIPFIADVAGFLRGTKDMEESLEDVADALDDLGHDKSADDLEDSFKDAAKAAEKIESALDEVGKSADASAEKTERSFKDSFKAVEAAGQTTSRKLKNDLDHVGGEGGAFADFKDEAKQNLAESVSSFQGDAESAVDAVQSTFGGLATALGPAGVVGSVIVAAGVGVLRSMATKAEEATQAVADKAVDMVKALREGVSPAEQLNDALTELNDTATTTGKWWWSEASTELLDLVKVAEDAGVAVGDFLRAAAGPDAHVTEQALKGVQDRITEIQRIIAEGGATGQGSVLASAYAEELGNLDTAAGELGTQLDTLKARTAAYNAELQYGPAKAEELSTSTSGLAEAMADAAKAARDANVELAENSRLTGDAAEAGWDMADALEAVNVKTKGHGATLNENTKAGRENAREVKNAVDAINDWGEAQIAAGGSVKDTNTKLKTQEDVLVNKIAPAFGGSKQKAREYLETLGGIPKKKDTDVNVSDHGTAKDTDKKIDEAAKNRTTTVTVSPDMAGFDRQVYKYLNGKKYYVTLAPRPGKNAYT